MKDVPDGAYRAYGKDWFAEVLHRRNGSWSVDVACLDGPRGQCWELSPNVLMEPLTLGKAKEIAEKMLTVLDRGGPIQS